MTHSDPKIRLKTIRQELRAFTEQLKRISAPLSLLVAGSAAYGFNKVSQGRLDDVDCIGIVDRSPEYFLSSLGLDNVDIPDSNTFHQFIHDPQCAFNIIRSSGFSGKIKISVYFVRQSDLARAIADSRYELKLLFPDNHPSIPLINSRLEVLGSGTPVSITPELAHVPNTSKAIIAENLFREIGPGLYAKGALADKLMISRPCYNGRGESPVPLIHAVWKRYATLSRMQHNATTSSDLIDLLVKSRFFSPAFRSYMKKRADRALSKELHAS